MTHKDICHLLASLEQKGHTDLTLHGVRVWPLLRMLLWNHFTASLQNGARTKLPLAARIPLMRRLLTFLNSVFQTARLYSRLHFYEDKEVQSLFFSSQAYLQKVAEKNVYWLDRVMDPLYFLSRHIQTSKKLYFGPIPNHKAPLYASETISSPKLWKRTKLSDEFVLQLQAVAKDAGVDEDWLHSAFVGAWRGFCSGKKLGRSLIKKYPSLNTIFLACWYVPDRMGLLCFLKQKSVTTVEVQHGKQGEFQGMYSWWTNLPPNGYEMLPDLFWCWGQRSVQHILGQDKDRVCHKPFVGGFLWFDYYRRFFGGGTFFSK